MAAPNATSQPRNSGRRTNKARNRGQKQNDTANTAPVGGQSPALDVVEDENGNETKSGPRRPATTSSMYIRRSGSDQRHNPLKFERTFIVLYYSVHMADGLDHPIPASALYPCDTHRDLPGNELFWRGSERTRYFRMSASTSCF